MPHQFEVDLPRPDFSAHHFRRIAAPPETVWSALSSLTLGDLTVTRPLLAMRHATTSRGRLDKPLMTDGPVTLLGLDPPAAAVAGAIGRPWRPASPRRPVATLEDFCAFDEPGWAKYLTDFVLVPAATETVLHTTTRTWCTDQASRAKFAAYWTLIRAGSGIIRRDMLRSVARISTGRDRASDDG